MATSETKENTCLVCLVAPAVRKVDTCQHSYCETCLSSPNFACPQCVTEETEGPGVDRGGRLGQEGKPDGPKTTESATKEHTKKVNCKLCHFKGKAVKATGFCLGCRKMPMCLDCMEAHRNNSLTQDHEVVPAYTTDEVNCLVHDEPLALFCTTCSIYICHVCISLEHVDHEVTDVVQTELENVKDVLKRENDWLDMLKSDERELEKMKATAQEMEAELIKEIEDHVEKCIARMLKNKKALKKQVKSGFFEVVRAMEKCLGTMPELQKKSADAVTAAKKLLSEQALPIPAYVEKLVKLKQQLGELKEGRPAYEEEKAKFDNFNEDDITFYPRTPNCNIGGFEDPGPRCNAGGPCVCDTCEQEVAKLPDAARVKECRVEGKCTCGTCGCGFDHQALTGNGRCSNQYYACNNQYPTKCDKKITVGDRYTFP